MNDIIKKFVKRVYSEDIKQFRAILVHKDGKMWGEAFLYPNVPVNIHSAAKSFMSTAVGIAIGEGILSLDDKPIDYFPEYLPDAVCDRLASLTLRHLLTMSSGHAQSTFMRGDKPLLPLNPYDSESWIKQYLSKPIQAEPGTRFWYESGDTYTAGAMLQKKTGMTLVEYLKPRLFEPLGIETPYWVVSPNGYNISYTGLWLSVADMMKFGELYLNNGYYKVTQLIPVDWIKEATSFQIRTDDNDFNKGNETLGYGYQFWMGKDNCYRAAGLGGQHIIMLPKQNACAVISAFDIKKADLLLDVFWEEVLPFLD